MYLYTAPAGEAHTPVNPMVDALMVEVPGIARCTHYHGRNLQFYLSRTCFADAASLDIECAPTLFTLLISRTREQKPPHLAAP